MPSYSQRRHVDVLFVNAASCAVSIKARLFLRLYHSRVLGSKGDDGENYRIWAVSFLKKRDVFIDIMSWYLRSTCHLCPPKMCPPWNVELPGN